jgi:hypothetical protein
LVDQGLVLIVEFKIAGGDCGSELSFVLVILFQLFSYILLFFILFIMESLQALLVLHCPQSPA